jgi:hypothetical protein
MYIIISLLKMYVMKKIFTLLFTIGLFTLAQAQPGTRDRDNRDNRQIDQRDDDRYDDEKDIDIRNRPYDNDDRYGNSRFGNERRMRMQIAQINREYDYKIQRVRNSFFMSRWEKQRQIRFLEDQRQQEIRFVYAKFKNKGRHNDHGYPGRRHH